MRYAELRISLLFHSFTHLTIRNYPWPIRQHLVESGLGNGTYYLLWSTVTSNGYIPLLLKTIGL